MSKETQRRVYYHKSTKNKSFLDMHCFLKDIGITNNRFMLALIDTDLAHIDPYDPNLNAMMKAKILRECMCNYWYFLREVVRIPIQGGPSVKYHLHRGNMAFNFAVMLNLNTYLELPRQNYKTISAVIWYLYVFNFGTSNSQISLLNKKHDDSKRALSDLKSLREMLPSYLRMDQPYGTQNKKIKVPDTVEKLQHPINRNSIKTLPSASSKSKAANLLRGQTVPLLYFDEFAFMPFNMTVYLNGVPAYKTAADNARANGAPFGINVTTTPGDLTSEEGQECYDLRNNASEFNENWYDLSKDEIYDIINSNIYSNFVRIIYSYQQLGRSEQWFAEICKDMNRKFNDIRREVLLEWSHVSENCPFSKDDLDSILRLIRDPIKTILFLNKYNFHIYKIVPSINFNTPLHPPIIGVDVSGGYQKDASAITCIESNTTEVFATLNCNHISPFELANCIHELVSKYMTNAIVNVERNGGFGASVLAKLVTSNIKKNLYFEIKDRIIEETNDGIRIVKKKQKTKVYGFDSTKNSRDLLMEILRERVLSHKDKFIARIIYEQLRGMETKRSGKIEHSANTHDDQIFSLLMALYVWYEGKNLYENFNIKKMQLKTDEDLDEVMLGLEEQIGNIVEEIYHITSGNGSLVEELNIQLSELDKNKGVLYNQWMNSQSAYDDECERSLLQTPLGKKAFMDKYHMTKEEVEALARSNDGVTLPDSVFMNFNMDDDEIETQRLNDNFNFKNFNN